MSVALVAHKQSPPPAAIPPTEKPVSKQQKAAILLSALVGSGEIPELDSIATEPLRKVVDIMASFGEVDRNTVDLVILEFLSELQDFGLSMRSDLEATLASLQGHLSEKAIDSIRRAYILSPSVDVWVRVASASADQLQACIDKEHVQIAATVLSKVPSTLAAQVLGSLEPARARSIMLAIINNKELPEDLLKSIGRSISETIFEGNLASTSEKTPVERAGDIINFAQREARDRIMEDLGSAEPETAKMIRKVMFTFADIPSRVLPRDIPAITRTVAQETLLRALKGAPTEVEFIFSSLSKRVAEQLKEELAELDPIPPEDSEAAMNEIIVGIRKLESDGEITLKAPDDD